VWFVCTQPTPEEDEPDDEDGDVDDVSESDNDELDTDMIDERDSADDVRFYRTMYYIINAALAHFLSTVHCCLLCNYWV